MNDLLCFRITGMITVLLAALSLAISPLHAQENPIQKEATVKQGSKLKAKFNRSTLRKYAVKIKSGEITKSEITDYIIKGGSLDQFQSYNGTTGFFIGSTYHSLLNFFLVDRYDQNKQVSKNRLEILSVLLSAGANPNFSIESAGISKNDNLAPILQACAADDVEALKLFIQYKANLELYEKTYLGTAGPCLATARSPQTLEWLLVNGANINAKDNAANTLIHTEVNTNGSPQKISWLLSKGISSQAKNKYGEKAIDIVNGNIEVHKSKIQSYKDRLQNTSSDRQNLNEAIAFDQKAMMEQQQLIDVLSSK